MVSKCANPECSAKFLYLHQGKIFLVTPPLDLQTMSFHEWGLLEERFWLCDECCQKLKIVWGGAQPKVVPLSVTTAKPPRLAAHEPHEKEALRKSPVSAAADVCVARQQEVAMAVADVKLSPLSEQNALFRNILVAVDFSDPSRRALSAALALARKCGSHLSAVHVLRTDWRYEVLESPPELELEQIDAADKLRSWTEELQSELVESDLKISSILLKCAPPAHAIAALASESQTDLIVLGTHGRGGLLKFALGSVSEEILRTAPCPVITIGPKCSVARLSQPLSWSGILLATDFGPGSRKALKIALALAAANQSRLILLHMLSPMPVTSANLSAFSPPISAAEELKEWETSQRQRVLRQMKECLPPQTGLAQEPEYVVGTDFLPEGVLITAEKLKADLIVMGANRTTAARAVAHLPWTAVHEVLASAQCPVLTVAE